VSDNPHETRNTAVAAAIILLAISAALYFMPVIILWLGNFSPALGFAFGACVILGFFAIFWVRSRYKK
jgi:hypothetical protein